MVMPAARLFAMVERPDRTERELPEVVLDCLNLDLESSGGVARYTARLLDGLIRHARTTLPPRFHFQAVQVHSRGGPPAEEPGGPVHNRVSLRDAAKAVARQSLPPRVSLALGAVYRRSREIAGQLAPRSPAPSTAPGRGQLVHQVMQYVVGSTVERLAADHAAKVCVTIIDHQELFFPDFFTPTEVARRNASSEFFAGRSDHSFAISAFSKDVFCERYGVAPERVTVTHLAPDLHDPPSPADLQWARMHGRFVLYPAKPWAHKNHARLFAAVAACAGVLRSSGLHVLLTGGFTSAEVERVNAELSRQRIGDLVHYSGFVTEAQLYALYASAEWLVFPSLFEGFGMPVVEAMQMRCPVMASNLTALPEIAGDAAILFDPTRVTAITELLVAAARDELDRTALIERGEINARRFRWQDTVTRTLEGYARVLG
jgi:glycosyltransferase involved in cell wall biosynthesis